MKPCAEPKPAFTPPSPHSGSKSTHTCKCEGMDPPHTHTRMRAHAAPHGTHGTHGKHGTHGTHGTHPPALQPARHWTRTAHAPPPPAPGTPPAPWPWQQWRWRRRRGAWSAHDARPGPGQRGGHGGRCPTRGGPRTSRCSRAVARAWGCCRAHCAPWRSGTASAANGGEGGGGGVGGGTWPGVTGREGHTQTQRVHGREGEGPCGGT
jgi:hypothetical protein